MQDYFARFQVVDFDVPGLPVEGLVVEDGVLVGGAGKDLAVGFAVVEGGDEAGLDGYCEVAVLEAEDSW